MSRPRAVIAGAQQLNNDIIPLYIHGMQGTGP